MPVDDTYQLTQPTTTITVNEQRYLMTVHTKYSRQPKIKNQNWLANRGQSTKNNIGQTGSVGIIFCLTITSCLLGIANFFFHRLCKLNLQTEEQEGHTLF